MVKNSKNLFLVVLLLVSCSTNRGPDRRPAVSDIPQNLFHAIQDFESFLESDSLDRKNCGIILNDKFQRLMAVPAHYFDRSIVDSQGLELIEALWSTTQLLRKKFGQMASEGPVDTDCTAYTRNFLRAGRFMIDVIGEHYVSEVGPNGKRRPIVLVGSQPWIMGDSANLISHQQYLQPKIESGDVILTRGVSASSAAIARVSDDETSFAHLSLVYKDPKTGKIWIVEAEPIPGVRIWSWEKWSSYRYSRATLYRYKDQAFAHKAAALAYQKAKSAIDRGKPIPYDYAMDMNDDSHIFCSELLRWAFKLASQDEIKPRIVPSFPTAMVRNRGFLEQCGITVSNTFAPGDLEIEPTFDLIAEWRDFSKTRQLRYNDAILSKIFEWMAQENYELKEPRFNRSFRIGLGLAKEIIGSPGYKNVKPKFMLLFLSILDVTPLIQKEVEKIDQDYRETHGISMSHGELKQKLEELKQADYERWVAKKRGQDYEGKIIFHHVFHPAGKPNL